MTEEKRIYNSGRCKKCGAKTQEILKIWDDQGEVVKLLCTNKNCGVVYMDEWINSWNAWDKNNRPDHRKSILFSRDKINKVLAILHVHGEE